MIYCKYLAETNKHCLINQIISRNITQEAILLTKSVLFFSLAMCVSFYENEFNSLITNNERAPMTTCLNF